MSMLPTCPEYTLRNVPVPIVRVSVWLFIDQPAVRE